MIFIFVVLLGGQYLITDPDSLITNSADYFIITHPDFTSALYPLCELRDSLGLDVKMVEVDLVYATFPYTYAPQSIRACMQNIYDTWDPRPEYVLLVGDADQSGGSNDFIPSPIFNKFNYPYWNGLTQHGADTWYVTLDGSDSIPDMILGRLPVNDTATAHAVVDKIIQYETDDTTGLWQTTVLVNSSSDFEPYAQGHINDYFDPAGDSVIKIYDSQGNSPSLRQRHIDAINQGVYMILPVCHGTQPPAWVGTYTLFNYSDITSLTNEVYPIDIDWG
jgi:hypothetical protein